MVLLPQPSSQPGKPSFAKPQLSMVLMLQICCFLKWLLVFHFMFDG